MDLNGYDIIGDVHGCASALEDLLTKLDYVEDGAYAHPTRKAIFVGDLIDRGPEHVRALEIVKGMVDAGTALIAMGNHEFNAIAYATADPDSPGEYLRRHTAANGRQHHAFLTQLTPDQREYYIDWFMTIPLWLDLGDLRVVHACWDSASLSYLEQELGGSRFTSTDQIVRSSRSDDPLFTRVETVLKGPEISLASHRQASYVDKDGHVRSRARLRWWHEGPATLRGLAEMGGNFRTEDGQPYPALPDTAVPTSGSYTDQVPVFYGHYWRQGSPEYGHDYTTYTACVDFSAVRGGRMTAYRWSGEEKIAARNYVQV
ncbi:MAG: metallophosphoesterase [Nocardiaceae bacterium]|nr:metallophosphoesterase [Nocardiaceae bacterium]